MGGHYEKRIVDEIKTSVEGNVFTQTDTCLGDLVEIAILSIFMSIFVLVWGIGLRYSEEVKECDDIRDGQENTDSYH